jgi:hypothetical protein
MYKLGKIKSVMSGGFIVNDSGACILCDYEYIGDKIAKNIN